jgi:excisionase family DNA binding protein
MEPYTERDDSPWMDARRGASYARVSRKLLYRAIRGGKLKAARVGGRREVRLRKEWLDQFIESQIPKLEQ